MYATLEILENNKRDKTLKVLEFLQIENKHKAEKFEIHNFPNTQKMCIRV